MKRIMCAGIEPIASSIDPIYYQTSAEVTELEDSREALNQQRLSLRDVLEIIIENAQAWDRLEIVDHDIWGTIYDNHHTPDGLFLAENGAPTEFYWVEG